MIEARNLTKRYGNREAISNVSFSVKKGEVVGFLGPNGAGKTTTMKILTGCMAPQEGSVLLDRVDVLDEPIKAKRKLGYLPESPPVYGDMYVEDYLKYVAQLKLCSKKEIPELVKSALKKVGLEDVKRRLIQNLSKGFRQRVGLAQALVSNPDILILDEPTVGLDPKQVKEIRDTLLQLRGEHTIILSTHILSEVQASCDRVIVINHGKIIIEDSLKGLSQKMKQQREITLVVQKTSEALRSQLKEVKGVLGVKADKNSYKISVEQDMSINEKLAQKALSSSAGLLELKEKSFNLEDIFIHLTEDQATEDQATKAQATKDQVTKTQVTKDQATEDPKKKENK